MRGAVVRSVAVVTLLTVMLPARIESVRWWQSSDVVEILHLSPAQFAALDQAYERTLPEMRRLSETITQLTDDVVRLNEDGASDVELMPVTEKLARAVADRCQMSAALSAAVARVLDADQRRVLARLVTR